jgi:hypothetical protein
LEKLLALRLGWPVATSVDTQERFEVAADRYQRNIELYQGEAKVGTAYFGSSPGYRRVHARSAESNDIYSLDFSTFELPTTVDDWLDKALLGATGAITEITRGGRWTLSKTAEGWMLVDLPGAALTADQDAVGQLVERLRGFRVMALADSEATADWESADKLTLADGDGVHELQLWHDAETDEYVVDSSRATSRYTAASYGIEQILVEAVDLAVEDAAPTD